MLLEYKNLQAKLIYCPQTKGYYGEVLGLDGVLTFQASNRQQAMLAMQFVVDEYWDQLQDGLH